MALGSVDDTNFMIQSFDVYRCTVDASDGTISSGTLLCYTEPDFTITMNRMYAEFKTGIPKSTVRRDITEQTLEISFQAKEWDDDLIQLLTDGKDGTVDSSGATFYGSEPEAATIYGWEFRGKRVDDKVVSFVIRKGRITTEDISINIGSGEYSNIPVKITAEVDENVADAATNLAFWKIQT